MEENTESSAASRIEIRFFSWTNPTYRCFSNFYPAQFWLDGKIWATSEHYYQAMKSTDPAMQDYIRTCGKPSVAKEMGGMTHNPNWDAMKDGVMRKCLRAKFMANLDIKEKLLGTGDALLIEASPGDFYWGEGSTKTGKNRLGVLLPRGSSSGEPFSFLRR